MLSSRQTAIAVQKALTGSNNSNSNDDNNSENENGKDQLGVTSKNFGPESQVRLLSDLTLSEVEAVEVEDEKYQNMLKEANYIVDEDKARQLIDMIIKVRCPIVMEFHQVFFEPLI